MPAWLIAIGTHPITLLMIGGGLGTNARYWLGKLVLVVQAAEVRFPWATFLINVTGSAILGVLAAAYLNPKSAQDATPTHKMWYLLLGTGFCGGFTTFSTFSLETFELIQEGKSWLAVLYVLGSVGAGLLGVWVAVKLAG